MVLRSLSRAGVEIGGKVAAKGRSVGAISHKLAGYETRHSSSWVGQGQFGRSHASSYRQGGLGAGTQLFKLVETDLMSKELTRYGPTDAEHLGLHSVQDVLADIAAATSALPETVVAVADETSEDAEAAPNQLNAPTPAVREEDVLAAWGLGPRVSDSVEEAGQIVGRGEEGSIEEGLEKMAIKRTYQPSTLKRKRKHGFLYRAKTRLGKKILQRRQEKGRWRLGI